MWRVVFAANHIQAYRHHTQRFATLNEIPFHCRAEQATGTVNECLTESKLRDDLLDGTAAIV